VILELEIFNFHVALPTVKTLLKVRFVVVLREPAIPRENVIFLLGLFFVVDLLCQKNLVQNVLVQSQNLAVVIVNKDVAKGKKKQQQIRTNKLNCNWRFQCL